jgi:hypothetical protein
MTTKIVPLLPDDIWYENIFPIDVLTAYRARALSKTHRRELETLIRKLFGIVVNCQIRLTNQGHIQDIFCITAAEARKLPYTPNQVGRYCIEHVFNVFKTHARLQEQLGPAELRRRIALRDERKRKREEGEASLPDRKRQAAETRRNSLSRAVKAAKLGETLEAWAEALKTRSDDDFDALATNSSLKSYLSEDALKPSVTLKAAMEEIKEIDANYTPEKIAERTQAAAQRENRRLELAAALASLKLQRRPDSAICDAYERGQPIGVFNTPAKVAKEMAKMHWLHNYTDYRAELRECVYELKENEGYYYEGINGDARDIVQSMAKFKPPSTWPWL